MSAREEVLNEFGTAECWKGEYCTHFDCVAERKMADEIVRLRTALTTAERERDEARRERDALRAVVEAAREFVDDYSTDANHAVWLMSNLETAVRALDAARGGEG